MSSANTSKDINDPIYSFITISNPFLLQIIEDSFFQRLRRIHQMGLSYLVFPGARHSRFEHAMGSMHLMQKAIQVLRSKSIEITEKEEEALLIAILLHDVGHAPFSHAMERSLISLSHEVISLKIMKILNEKHQGRLNLAIDIFQGTYYRKFLNQLVSGQLDMDRLDYLKRDSFFTAVPEGHINNDRIIAMLNVINDELVIEEKAIYPVEKFLIARRFMYWQVYFHKVSLVSEQMLVLILKRAREVSDDITLLEANNPLLYFLKKNITKDNFEKEALKNYYLLDDYDIIYTLKKWMNSEDKILSTLCNMIINRNLLKCIISKEKLSKDEVKKYKIQVCKKLDLSMGQSDYFVFQGKIKNQAYDNTKENINILMDNEEIKDITEVSDNFNLKALSTPVIKHYTCYHRHR